MQNYSVDLGVLRFITGVRRDFKVIISSATIGEHQLQEFTQFFNNAEVFEIQGRMWPVEVIYCHLNSNNKNEYIDAAAEKVKFINENEDAGDVLVFMTGKLDVFYLQYARSK